ncbi:glycosyltransferase family 39 protein [Azospirillum sp. SYSU D00513]|uniref:glycosyltransferase family 39 protein n=1 Tax=Azospirillum sp. SYSU D00513 TaxID=2812561 RepID=UPI001A96B88C|nr:glycosyltransferase family 39 protein [Azospirillum sp. SYSU D00513]
MRPTPPPAAFPPPGPRGPGGIAALPWWASCALLAAALLASASLLGLRLPYWWNADQDLVLAYHGLLLNEGLPQEYFDHPGYTYFLVIAGWYRLLHGLGLLPVHTLSALPPLADTAAYDLAWQQLVEAGRVLSMLLCAAWVVAVATLVRHLLDDRRIGFLAGLALAFAVGVASQARQMRTDLLSAAFAALALLLVLVALRKRPGAVPLLLFAGAGASASLAMISKVQAIFPLMALPVLALAFGRRPVDGASWTRGGGAWLRAGAAAALAALALVPAAGLILEGIAAAGHSLFPYAKVGGGLSGLYQGVIAGWAALGVLVYAAVWRVPAAYAASVLAAVAGGLGLGLLVLTLRWHEQNAIAVANPIEHMYVFSSWRHAATLGAEQQVLNESLLMVLLNGLWRTFAIRTIVLHPDNIPQTLILEWFAIAAAAVAWRRGDRATALRVGLLLLTAWGLETLFALRGFKRAYHVYTDPLVVLAAALALARFPALLEAARNRRQVYGVLALYLALAHVWPVIAERRRPDPAAHCDWIPIYMTRIQGFPFCPPRP